jgi:hypothetical protein
MMTWHGKLNLIGMLSLPVVTMVAVLVATKNGVFDAYAATYGYLFIINAIPMLFGGLVSWRLLRKAIGDPARMIAVTPTLIPAAIGIIWYLWRAIFPAEVAPGAEYIAAPQYLLIWVAGISLLAWLAGRIVRKM